MKNALINGKNSLPCRISGCKAYPIGMVLGRDLVFERWQEIGQQLRLMEGSLLWWIGDWSNYGEKKYGDKYESAIEATGLAYQTIANARMVAKAFQFSRRRENLTWSHHLEMCSLHESEQDKFLDEAEEEKLSKQELREAIREKRLEQLANEHPLPNGKFSVLYADPPWLYHDQRTGFSDSGAAAAHYPVMPLDSICGLTDGNGRQIQGVIADDAVLFLGRLHHVCPKP